MLKKRIMKTVIVSALLSTSIFAVVNAAETNAVKMIPWDNSNLEGWISEETTVPDLKDDFYQAINAEWIAAAEFIPGYPMTSAFSERMEQTNAVLTGLMTDTSLESHDAKLIQSLYNIFLDWDTRNELGFSQFIPHIETIEAISSVDELTEYLVSDEGRFYGTSLNPIGAPIVDLEDPNVYCLAISYIALSLGDSSEYEILTENGKNLSWAHREISKIALEKFGYSEERITEILDNSYAFEKMISASIPSKAEKAQPDYTQSIIHKVTFEELKELSPVYPLTEIMEFCNMSDWNNINVYRPEFIEKLNEVYTEENLALMKDYLICNFAKTFASRADEDTYHAINEITNQSRGVSVPPTDELYAFSFTANCLPTALDKTYTQICLTAEMKEDIISICEDIIASYREMLSKEEWMSEDTKAKAIEKLDNITINAAYPNKWRETDSLNIVPSEEGGTLWDALLAIKKQEFKYYESMKNAKVDKACWETSLVMEGSKIADTNAFYDPQYNSINIIGGILGEPIYSTDMSDEEKLARIGCVIGHEISHAFDTTGARFDKDGYLCNWWTEEDYTMFTERAQKLIDYYDKMVVLPDGYRYSGSLVQGEAIADMGGLKCMLLMAEKIEDFDYDLFFRSYAEAWRSKESSQHEYYLVSSDTHPLDYLRINIGVQQFDEFMETYNIEPGDGMYLAKEDRILVW